MRLSGRIREATGSIHARVEALPLAQAMVGGTVDREDYASLLRRLLFVHREWEHEVAAQPACDFAWSTSMARASILEGDLAALGSELTKEPHPSAEVWLEAVRDRAEARPEVWLGVIYLFEGSRMGSMALIRPLSVALGVPPRPGMGLDYHLDGIADRVPRWQRLKDAIDDLELDEAGRQAVIWAASTTFEMLYELYATRCGVTSEVNS